jgi:DNA-binding LytR/AlgR family response regulator
MDVGNMRWVVGASIQSGIDGEAEQLERVRLAHLKAQCHALLHVRVVGELVMGKDKEGARLKGAVKAAQAYFADLETVNWVGVGEAKVIWPLCWCNVIALVISVAEYAVQQELAELGL